MATFILPLLLFAAIAVEQMLKEGVMICTGGYEVGRKLTKRQMPW